MNQVQHQKAAVFFDTNIALHYQRIDQVDWPAITGHKQVEIIVSAVVLSELDKHKTDNFSKKLRKRAAEYSGWLLEKFSAPALNQHVSMVFRPNEPLLDFAQHQLDRTILDDRLMAAVIEYMAAFPGQQTCVITADIGLTLKLKMRGITVFNLPDKYRLSEEADADEIEMRNLRSQLARYTNRQPKLSLAFQHNEQVLNIERTQFVDKDTFIATKMEKIKAAHPLLVHTAGTLPLPTTQHKSLQQLSAQIGQAISSMSHTQQGMYNSSLERYYIEYRTYLEDVYDHALRASAQIALPIQLSNVDGSAPATNIDIILRSPDGISFIKKRQERPEAPTAPRKPSSSFDIAIDSRPPLIASHMPNLREIMRENAADQPKLMLSPGVAQFSVPALKHKQQTTLLPVLLDFGAPENVRNITISYEIHAHEMLEPVHQQLHLKLAA